MNEQIFKRLIADVHARLKYAPQGPYSLWTCHVIGWTFGYTNPAYAAYREFIQPHLKFDHNIMKAPKNDWPELRMMLLQAFEEEILAAGLHAKWPMPHRS